MAKSRAQYIQEHSDGSNDISFDLVDESTVKRLQRDKKINVPKKKVDIPKDKRWNEKQMASKIMQGIQNGDSIAKISKSMTEVIGNNLTSAIRNTRTMTTSAECNGRLDSYKSLADQGVVQKKVWMATPDDRTRPTHIDLDGEEQDIDKAFSNGCQFPGDGNGPAEEVWQCRCTMTDHIIGFKRADGSISYVDYNRDNTLHNEQMEATKERRGIKEKPEKQDDNKVEIPEDVQADIQEYVNGTGENFTAFAEEETIDFVKEHMEESTDTFYRVEQERFTAKNLEEGDVFSFKDDIRSFSNGEESMYDILNQSEEIDPSHEYVIFETQGEVKHFPVDKYLESNQFAEQKESLLNGKFEVVSKYYDGDDTLRVVIKQKRG